MFKYIVKSLAVVLILQACQKSDQLQTTESGLKYAYIEKSDDGSVPADGEIMILNMAITTSTDSVILEASQMPLQKSQEIWDRASGGIEEGFSLLGLGDSLKVIIKAKDLYERTWRRPLPANISPEEEITCTMKLTEILDAVAYQRKEAMERVSQVDAFREQLLAEKQEIMSSDGEIIDAYLEKNNIQAQTTQTGLRYVIIEEGDGPTAEVGDQVSVNYTGKVLEGEFFDTSYEDKAKELGLFNSSRPYGPYEFILGTGGVIHGWDEGIGLLNKGAKARLFIPSPMGYGDQQKSDVIVSNSILEFDVELVDVVTHN